MTTPNLQLVEVPESKSAAADELNESFWALDVLAQPSVLGIVTAPPASPSQGDKYIVDSGGTGVFIGRDRHVAYYTPAGWRFVVPRRGWIFKNLSNSFPFTYGGTQWTAMLKAGDGIDITVDADGGLEFSATAGGGGGGGNLWDEPPDVPDGQDDEFSDESFDSGKWVWNNQGAATTTEDSTTFEHLMITAPAVISDNIRNIEQTLAASPCKYRCKLFVDFDDVNFANGGICLRNSVSGKLMLLGQLKDTTLGVLRVQKWSSPTAFSANTNIAPPINTFGHVYYEIEDDGTNIYFRYSATGHPLAYRTLFSEARGTFFSGGNLANRVGLYINATNNNIARAFVKWFRRVQ